MHTDQMAHRHAYTQTRAHTPRKTTHRRETHTYIQHYIQKVTHVYSQQKTQKITRAYNKAFIKLTQTVVRDTARQTHIQQTHRKASI